MQIKKICYQCMKETKNENGVCSSCGFDSSKYVPEAYQLQPMTPLNGRYLVGKAIGVGGFGITYIALDTQLQIPVAIKELYIKKICRRSENNRVLVSPNNRKLYEENKDHFLAEARVLAMFSKDDGVVAVKEHFEENDTAYIVMEYLEGRTLKKHVQSDKLSYKSTTSLLKPIGKALTKIHQFNVVHKDVSPDNIMVLENSNVKLLDFGGAINTDVADNSKSVSFKRGYAPPEQYVRNGEIGSWTDVYALAATAYYCLTGVKPADSMERKAGKSLQKPSELGVKIPQKAEAALMKALEIEPHNRFQTVEEFWNEWDLNAPSGGISKKLIYAGAALIAVLVAIIIITVGGKEKHYNVGDIYDAGEGVYMFVNAEDDKYCLGVNQNFADDYTELSVFTSDEEGGVQAINSNRFYVSEANDEDYRTMQVCHTNSFIEISEEGHIYQKQMEPEEASSQWQLVYAGHDENSDEDIVMIRNIDGRVITPADNAIENGNSVSLEQEDGSYIQRWKMRWSPIDEDAGLLTVHQEGDLVEELSGTKTLISAYGDAGEVLMAVSGDASLENPQMIVWENVWDETQQFRFEFTGNESRYRIYPIKQSGNQCLEYDPESKRIVMKNESDNENQLFRIVYSNFGTYLIQTYDDKILGFDANEDGSVNGRPIEARPYDSVSDSRFEKWLIKDVK